MNQLLVQYSYLQLLDFLTTIAFLLHGVGEGNPLVRFAIRYAPHPLEGLLIMKVAAVGLGIYCWAKGRDKLLFRINILFAAVALWNIAALIAISVSTIH